MRIYIILIALCVSFLAGCSHPRIDIAALQAQSQVSNPLILSAVPDSAKTLYIQFANQTRLSAARIEASLIKRLEAAGYKLEANSAYAHYLLFVDLKRVMRLDESIAHEVGQSGYNIPLVTVPIVEKGYETGVADVKLVEKSAYAPGGRETHYLRLAVLPNQPNLKKALSKAVIEGGMAQRIAQLFQNR